MSTITRAAGGRGPGAAAPGRGGPGPRTHVRHVGALARRNLMQMKASPDSVLDVLLMPVVFTALFVYVFGGAIAGDRQEYLQYMLPGLMAQMSMMVAMAVGTGLNSDMKTGVMDRFRSLPIARSSVLVAKVVVEMGRMAVALVVLLAFGMLLGLEVRTGPAEVLGAIGLTMAFGSALVWLSMLLGLSVNSPQAVQGVGMVVLMPLQFGSSIFAPTDTMPGWLQGFTEVNPLSSLADACRALVNGGPAAGAVWSTLAWVVGITAVVAPLAVTRFRRRV